MTGRAALAGGIVHRTRQWVVNHCVGPLDVGTLVLAPCRHIVAVAELSDEEVAEMGPLLRRSARVVERLCDRNRSTSAVVPRLGLTPAPAHDIGAAIAAWYTRV